MDWYGDGIRYWHSWYNLDIQTVYTSQISVYIFFLFICMSLLGTVYHLAEQNWAIIACGNTGHFWYYSFGRSSCCTISSLWDSAQSMSAVKNHGKDQHQCSWCPDQLKPSWIVLNPKNHGIQGYTPLWRYGFWRSMNIIYSSKNIRNKPLILMTWSGWTNIDNQVFQKANKWIHCKKTKMDLKYPELQEITKHLFKCSSFEAKVSIHKVMRWSKKSPFLGPKICSQQTSNKNLPQKQSATFGTGFR